MKKHHVLIGAVVMVGLLVTGLAYAQGTAPERETKMEAALGTAFTFQGRLSDETGLVDDTCDLSFELYDVPGSGTPPTGGTLLGMVEKPDQGILGGSSPWSLTSAVGPSTATPAGSRSRSIAALAPSPSAPARGSRPRPMRSMPLRRALCPGAG